MSIRPFYFVKNEYTNNTQSILICRILWLFHIYFKKKEYFAASHLAFFDSNTLRTSLRRKKKAISVISEVPSFIVQQVQQSFFALWHDACPTCNLISWIAVEICLFSSGSHLCMFRWTCNKQKFWIHLLSHRRFVNDKWISLSSNHLYFMNASLLPSVTLSSSV